MKYLFWPRAVNGEALEPIELDPASMEVLLDTWGQMPKPPFGAFLQRVNGNPVRLYTTDEVELVAEDGEVWTPSSPYPVKVPEPPGLSKRQVEQVKELIAEANRELARRLQLASSAAPVR